MRSYTQMSPAVKGIIVSHAAHSRALPDLVSEVAVDPLAEGVSFLAGRWRGRHRRPAGSRDRSRPAATICEGPCPSKRSQPTPRRVRSADARLSFERGDSQGGSRTQRALPGAERACKLCRLQYRPGAAVSRGCARANDPQPLAARLPSSAAPGSPSDGRRRSRPSP